MIRYLVIDDDPIQQLIVSKRIKLVCQDAEIYCFSDGAEWINYFESISPDEYKYEYKAFLDLNMPNLNGWQTLDYLQQALNPAIKYSVCIVTSSSKYYDRAKASNYPEISQYQIKPLGNDSLKLFIESETPYFQPPKVDPSITKAININI